MTCSIPGKMIKRGGLIYLILMIKLRLTGLRKWLRKLLITGIGGSYIGSKAVIDLFQHHFNDLLPEDAKSNLPHIIFAGQTLSEQYIADVKDILKNKDFSINVISKSGTTTEPAIALRI